VRSKILSILVFLALFCTPLLEYPRAFASTRIPGRMILKAMASGGATSHSTLLTWTASTSAAACSSTATPPCTFGYNVFRGTAAGGESTTPLNAAPITGTSYTDPVTLASSPATYYYTVTAVETVNSISVSSAYSNEASISYPGVPAPPTGCNASGS
jgi:hypothetical protein